MIRAAALSCILLSVFMTGCTSDTGEEAEEGTGAESTTGPEPQPCGTEWAEKDGMTPSVMDDWGAACLQDSDCMPILGDGAVCVTNILGVYDLPGGFCTKYCALPDTSTTFIHDAMDCDPNGGITCVGAKDLFTACIRPCENDSQCGREGYGCRTMPTLAAEGDPTFCLMSPVDCCTTESGECSM
jgi:hypothetical protein